jgi:hypothetical protein
VELTGIDYVLPVTTLASSNCSGGRQSCGISSEDPRNGPHSSVPGNLWWTVGVVLTQSTWVLHGFLNNESPRRLSNVKTIKGAKLRDVIYSSLEINQCWLLDCPLVRKVEWLREFSFWETVSLNYNFFVHCIMKDIRRQIIPILSRALFLNMRSPLLLSQTLLVEEVIRAGNLVACAPGEPKCLGRPPKAQESVPLGRSKWVPCVTWQFKLMGPLHSTTPVQSRFSFMCRLNTGYFVGFLRKWPTQFQNPVDDIMIVLLWCHVNDPIVLKVFSKYY